MGSIPIGGYGYSLSGKILDFKSKVAGSSPAILDVMKRGRSQVR